MTHRRGDKEAKKYGKNKEGNIERRRREQKEKDEEESRRRIENREYEEIYCEKKIIMF